MNVIYKTIPRHTEQNVAVDQLIEVYFMVDININSINTDTIILFNLKEQRVEQIKFTYQRRVLKVNPVQSLSAKGHYELQLVGGSNGIKDITGRTMAQTMNIEFQTKDAALLRPPVILTPTDVSVVKDQANFKLQPVSKTLYYELEISKSNTFHNLVWPVDNEKIHHTDSIEVTPDISYETGLYHARVRSANHEEEKSAWSETVRFFYDGAQVIQEMPEAPLPSEEQEEPLAAVVASKVVLQTASRPLHQDQLSSLQAVFSQEETMPSQGLLIKSSKPKDGSLNNNLERFNNLIGSGNQRRIVVEFTDTIDPNSITDESLYVLSERN